MSDKSILKGATKLTSLGGLDKVTAQRCLNATDPQDLYSEDKFNSEMQVVLDYINNMSKELKNGESKAATYANSSKQKLQNLYEEHLMVNSDSAKYNKMTELINQVINLNNAIANIDVKSAASWSDKVVETLSEIEKL